MSIWRFARFLPAIPASAQVTLGEGGTPLVRSRRIGPAAGLKELYFKLDGQNPTGSYKDRFAVTAVSAMVADGIDRCVATSSGNTGAALAGYCAAAGIRCYIAIVETAPLGKLRQMMAYGARIFRVRQFGRSPAVTSGVIDGLMRFAATGNAALQISAYRYSPVGMQGVQTVAHELAEDLAGHVEHVFCPAGSGGLVVAAVRGFEQLREAGMLARVPAVHVVQPTGNNTIAGPLRDGLARAQIVECMTHVSGLQVPNVIDGDTALLASRSTGGTGHLVTDGEVFEAQSRLAREEGIFTEPAGAAATAGVLAARRVGLLRADARVVSLITGLGFKDEAAVLRMTNNSECPMLESPNEMDAFLGSG